MHSQTFLIRALFLLAEIPDPTIGLRARYSNLLHRETKPKLSHGENSSA